MELLFIFFRHEASNCPDIVVADMDCSIFQANQDHNFMLVCQIICTITDKLHCFFLFIYIFRQPLYIHLRHYRLSQSTHLGHQSCGKMSKCQHFLKSDRYYIPSCLLMQYYYSFESFKSDWLSNLFVLEVPSTSKTPVC